MKLPGFFSSRYMPQPRLSRALRGMFALKMAALLAALAVGASAQNITGIVTNGTTGKPAGGVEVTLLSLAQGMEEAGSTKTDAQGRFSLPAPADRNAPHMVRATLGGVNYFPRGGPLMPGATTAQLTVYDTAKKIDGLSQTVEVVRLETQGDQLQAIALYAIRNESNPPRTLDNKRTFEFVLPPGATVDDGKVKGPGGQPITMSPVETAQKGRYAFSYPLKPGETQFQVSYHLPYKGGASFSPKPLADVEHLVVMTAPGMTFTAANPQRFQAMPNSPGVMVATNARTGEDLSFKVSGSGQFPQANGDESGGGADAAGGGGGAMGGGQAAAKDNRPGGGLGAPIDSNDPLHDYRAVILGVFAVVLVMGGAFVISKSNATIPAAAASSAGAAPDISVARDRNATLLEAMKDELFHLEIDRQQGKITQPEYEKAKAALDETIKRALARASS